MELVARVRAWWYRETHPGTCRACGRTLHDNEQSGCCSDECYVEWMTETGV